MAEISASPREQNRRRTSILFLVDQLTELGGGERILLELAQGLPADEFETCVVSFRDMPNPIVWNLPCDIRVLNMRKTYGLEALRTALRLRRLIRERRFDLVHTFFETSDIFGLIVARLSGVRGVISSRRDMGILRTAKHNIAYRLLSWNFDAILTVSEQVRERVIALDRVKSSAVITVHNGIQAEKFASTGPPGRFRREYGLPANAPIIATIANLQPWKGVDVFLRCAAEVHRMAPEGHFVVAGEFSDPKLTEQLRALAKELKIDHVLHFLGSVSDVRELLSSTDVFCLLSRSEGFPNVVLEAMAAGVPIVATRVGGTPEAVDHGVSGWLTNPGDHQDAADRVLMLLNDTVMRKTMAAAGLNRVRTQFTRQAMIEKYAGVYKDVLLRRGREMSHL
jgi:glycosyltransferase involved in cell wall biosynthesis